MRRFSVRMKLCVAAALALGACGIALASVDDEEIAPTPDWVLYGDGWTLDNREFNLGGSSAMLLPSNDTRDNLYLLLVDRGEVPAQIAKDGSEDALMAAIPWDQETTRKSDDSSAPGEGTRCQSNASGSAAFVAAVRASGAVPDAEKQLLIAARHGLNAEGKWNDASFDCAAATLAQSKLAPVRSPRGKEFANYLLAAQIFYAGRFDQAAPQFESLTSAADPWVRETATYMAARTLLNRAFARSLDEYGSLKEPDKRDAPSITAAGNALEMYLRAYPGGRYANSAHGLIRRVHWLAGDEGALAADYGRQLSNLPRSNDATPAITLIEEIDHKLLPLQGNGTIRDPILLAVTDLQRMRQPGEGSTRQSCCGPPIGQAEIEAQRPLFGKDTELYDYLRAAEAYFVRHRPAEVLTLIPDAAHQQRFTYLQFSRQMLRGLALQSLGDPHARPFWLSLFAGATQPYQHEVVELALAIHDERSGRLDLIFAPDSRVQSPTMRGLLLEHTAGPDILRQQASKPEVPRMEREIALYMLLSKELRRGFYRDFLSDVRLLPPEPQKEKDDQTDPPLNLFRGEDAIGNFGCPTLDKTVAALAKDARAPRPLLCLAEYFRDNGFDDFDRDDPNFDDPVPGTGLASTRSQFPAGTPYSRLEIYKSVISDPAATPDDKALALNRAIWCYGPSGNNQCGGIEVPVEQRRAWFVRLETEYAHSRWARELKYYW